jgi:alkyl hydroperoxide reductase subunit F
LDEVVDVERLSEGFEVRTASGQSFKTKTILFCTGAEHRKLNVPGEKEYTGRGISYCYTCDAPFFKNKKVTAVGGGNSGFEVAEQLLNYASTIYLLEISDQFRADEVLREKVLGNEKVIPLLRHRVVSAEGDGVFLKAIVVEDLEKDRTYRLDVEGLFVEIGLEPNTKLAQKLGVLLNIKGEIIIDCNNRTSEKGIYAPGDCTNIFAKQIITAAGDGAKALLSVYHDLTYGVSSWI